MTNPPLEEVEQKALVVWLKKNKIDHFAPLNENLLSFLSPKIAVIVEAKAKALGKRKGTLDVVIFLPKYILFLEMKRRPKTLKSGKLSYANSNISDEQVEFMKMLKRYSYTKSAVAYGYLEAIDIIEELR